MKILFTLIMVLASAVAQATFIFPEGIMSGEDLSLAKSSGDAWRAANQVLLTERMRVPPSPVEIAAVVGSAPFCNASFVEGVLRIEGITSYGERVPFPLLVISGGAFQQKFLDFNINARLQWKCSVPAELWGGGSIYRNFRFKEGGIVLIGVNAVPYRGMKGPLNPSTRLGQPE